MKGCQGCDPRRWSIPRLFCHLFELRMWKSTVKIIQISGCTEKQDRSAFQWKRYVAGLKSCASAAGGGGSRDTGSAICSPTQGLRKRSKPQSLAAVCYSKGAYRTLEAVGLIIWFDGNAVPRCEVLLAVSDIEYCNCIQKTATEN